MAYYGISNNTLYISNTATTEATTAFSEPEYTSFWPWRTECDDVTTVVIQNEISFSHMAYFFNGLYYATRIKNINYINMSNVWSTFRMFHNCYELIELQGINKWDMSNVTHFGYMFYGCESIQYLNLADWDTNSVERTDKMFGMCTSLQYLNLGNWSLDNCENFDQMFYGCQSLKGIHCNSTWTGVSGATSDAMFDSCLSLHGAIAYKEANDGIAYASPDKGYFLHSTPRIMLGVYENLLPQSTNTNGTIYNNVGYKKGYYFSASSLAESANSNVYLTGLMPIKYGDTIYLKNIRCCTSSSVSGYNRFTFFDKDFNYIGQVNAATAAGGWGASKDANNNITAFPLTKDTPSNITTIGSILNIAYFSLSAEYIGPDSIIAVNAPIRFGEHKVLDGIASTGTQYIDTGVSLNANTYSGLRMVIDSADLSTDTAKWAVNGVGGTSANQLFVGVTNGYIIAYGNGTSGINTGTAYTPGRMTFDLDVPNKKYTVGNSVALTNLTFSAPTQSYNAYLFAYNEANVAACHKEKIYSAQIYDNGTMVKDYKPVLAEDGTIGLYDLVSGAVCSNDGSGTFTAGTETGEVMNIAMDNFDVGATKYVKTGTTIPLSWYSYNTVDTYVLERSINGGEFTEIVNGDALTATSYQINETFDNICNVQYRVKAVVGSTESEYVYSDKITVYKISTYENLIVGGGSELLRAKVSPDDDTGSSNDKESIFPDYEIVSTMLLSDVPPGIKNVVTPEGQWFDKLSVQHGDYPTLLSQYITTGVFAINTYDSNTALVNARYNQIIQKYSSDVHALMVSGGSGSNCKIVKGMLTSAPFSTSVSSFDKTRLRDGQTGDVFVSDCFWSDDNSYQCRAVMSQYGSVNTSCPYINEYSVNCALGAAIPFKIDTLVYAEPNENGQYVLVTGDVSSDDRTPVEYKQVEYIESTGTQYIDTGFVVDASNISGLRVVIDSKNIVVNSSHWSVNGIGDSSPNTFLGITSNGQIAYGNGTDGINTGVSYVAGRMVFDLDVPNKKCTVGDLLALSNVTYKTPTAGYKFYLFGYNSLNTAYCHAETIYSCQIYSNSTLVRDFIPCTRNGEAGLFDKVNSKFYGNKGTGFFTAGPEI